MRLINVNLPVLGTEMKKYAAKTSKTRDKMTPQTAEFQKKHFQNALHNKQNASKNPQNTRNLTKAICQYRKTR